MINFSLAKCKTKAAYSAKLKQNRRLDLTRIKNHYQVLMKTPILIIIKTPAGEVIVHAHGELLFKKCADVDLMEKLAEEIYGFGLS